MDRIAPIVGLANRWFQPLTHLSLTKEKHSGRRFGLIFRFCSAKVDVFNVLTKFLAIFLTIHSKNKYSDCLFSQIYYNFYIFRPIYLQCLIFITTFAKLPIISTTYNLQTIMFRSITCSLRSVACLLTALFLCQAINADAQSTDRFFKIDKSMLESIITTESISYPDLPLLIVEEDASMAIQAVLNKTSTSMLPCPVTFTDGYAEISEGENNNVYFICEPIQDSKLQSGYELRILSCPTPYLAMELGVKSGKFYIDDSSVYLNFTLLTDESSNDCKFQLQTQYKKGGEYHSIVYTGAGNDEGFKLMVDNSKRLSFYRLDPYKAELSESPMDEDNNIVLTLSPHQRVARMNNNSINYILNNGEEVSISDLLSSQHSIALPSIITKPEPFEITLPNYNNDATTLWAIPTTKSDRNSPHLPFGPIYRATYSDISTGLTAPAVADAEEATPVYYTLQGIRVSEPSAAGVYLCRRGAKVTKIIVR